MLIQMRDGMRKVMHQVASLFGEQGVMPDSLKDCRDANEMLAMTTSVFEHFLPYESCLEDDIIVNKSTIGYGLHVSPGSGADSQRVKAHAEWLRHRLPEGFDLTVLLYKHHYLAADLSRGFAPILKRGGIYDVIGRMSLRYHLQAIKSGYKNRRNIPAQLADYRCYFLVSTKRQKGASRQLNDSRVTIESELTVAGYHHARLTRPDFKTLLRVLVSPNLDDIEWPECDDNESASLSKDMVRANTSFTVNDDSVDVRVVDKDGTPKHSRLVSLMVEKWPKTFALWSVPDLFANLFNPDKGIQCPFLISFTIRGACHEKVKNEAKSKAENGKKNNNAVQRFLNPNLVDEIKEWQYVYDESNKNNLTLHPTFYNILLFTSKEHERKHVAQTISAYREFNFELSQKPMGAWFRYLASLPFIISEGQFFQDLELLKCTKRLNHTACANLMPLIADFKGSPKGMLLPTYRHQIAYVDTFDNKHLPITNFNFVTVGSPGSGKSQLNQWRLFNGLAMDEIIFVIDLGDSYKNFCQLVGGTYLNASNLTLNPFTLFDFEGQVEIDGKVTDNYTQIRDLLAIMASPNEPLSSIQNDYLLEVVLACWKKHRRKTGMDDVLQELNTMLERPEYGSDSRLSDLIVHLKKFARGGIYGHMFNSETPFIENPEFVVLEMGEFENNPELLTIIMFVMIVIIQGQFYHTDRLRRKLCVIDEAWRFLAKGSNPIAARFIEQGFRTARKYNAGFGVIFQQLADMTDSIQGQAVAASSDIKFIMRQGNFGEYLKENPNSFDEKQQTLIKSFGEASSQGFSNVMVQYGTAYTFHRYFADPFTRVLFSSNAEEFSAIKRLRDEGMSLEKAVAQIAQKNYGDDLCQP